MTILEGLQLNVAVRDILPNALVTGVSVQWFGSKAIELTCKDPGGQVSNQLRYRLDEPRLEVVEAERPWSFDGDGTLFRLVSDAHHIRLAHLFDPVLAVHISLVEPRSPQITAVYDAVLPRQPLWLLLAAGVLDTRPFNEGPWRWEHRHRNKYQPHGAHDFPETVLMASRHKDSSFAGSTIH